MLRLCPVHEEEKVGVSPLEISCVNSMCYPGPAFLPSEHDELPPGVAFMVRMLTISACFSCADRQLRPSNVVLLQ
jgi:hypothetical protein